MNARAHSHSPPERTRRYIFTYEKTERVPRVYELNEPCASDTPDNNIVYVHVRARPCVRRTTITRELCPVFVTGGVGVGGQSKRSDGERRRDNGTARTLK
jgi:hypothetical protein|uniref:Uncharacterized protein n=1 Tax=Sipha flava TaxID=143950 RepID=A0A2S2R570_9HEMI